jgi:structural maintenance of chromosome 3 (chondroitin sulfate proteoglycan 6)
MESCMFILSNTFSYELFTADPSFNRAVDVVAGKSLLHIVVDSYETVTKILAVLNKVKTGRVTFIHLNRIRPRRASTAQLDQGVVRMLDKLVFDQRFEGVIRQVFEKAVVCRDLDYLRAWSWIYRSDF